MRNLVADAPGGTVTFQGTVDTGFSTTCTGGCDVTVSASTINFGGDLGRDQRLGCGIADLDQQHEPAVDYREHDCGSDDGGFC